jgi:hypothetical protein
LPRDEHNSAHISLIAGPGRPPWSDPTDQQGGGWETSEFQLREIAPTTYLLTYTLLHDAKLTRRATIWQRREADWTILYHQGTLVYDPVHHRREPEPQDAGTVT